MLGVGQETKHTNQTQTDGKTGADYGLHKFTNTFVKPLSGLGKLQCIFQIPHGMTCEQYRHRERSPALRQISQQSFAAAQITVAGASAPMSYRLAERTLKAFPMTSSQLRLR
eukprot:6214741-Pleurochrysis_carterae.AAC.2